MNRVSRISAALFLGSVACLSVSASHAQGIITGSIAGTIADPSGAMVSGAAVKATNVDTGIVLSGTTNNKGEVKLDNMPIGTYTVAVQQSGFATLTVTGVVVATGEAVNIGKQQLSLTSAESVSVSTAQSLLETTQSQLSTTISSLEITDLPTGGGLDRLALLVPGVVRTLGAGFSNTNGTGLSSNGLRGRANNFEIDGQTNNDNSVAGPQIFFRNEDAVGELQIITNNFSAQYGRNAGDVINYITKSGTNSFHGTAFENYLGSWGSSLQPFQKNNASFFITSPVVPRVTANEYGGTLGGPIFRDKLFFFGSTLFRKITNGASPSNSTTLTPTPAGLQQLQAAFPGNGFVAGLVNSGPYSVTAGSPHIVPGSTPQQIAVCAIGTAAACPAGSPTAEFGYIQRLLPSSSSDQEDMGRLDYQFTPKDRFFLRYIYQTAPTNVAGGTISSGAYYNVSNINHSIGADYTHTFGPHWLNQIRYGFQQSKLTFDGGGYSSCTVTSLLSCPANVGFVNSGGSGLPTLGFGLQTNIPQGRIVKVTQVQDNANWNFGKHAISFGGEFDYQNSPNTFLPNTSGNFTFGNFNNALAGVGTLALANGKPSIPFREPDVAAYLQDDWRFNQSLTLNLGVRWEFFDQSINVLNDLTVANQHGANPIWLTTLPDSLTTFPRIANNYKNFEPRVGFAYNPTSQPGLVIRGGFSIGRDPAFYNIFLNSYTSAPVVNTGVIACNGSTVNCLPSGGLTNAQIHAQDDQYNPTNVNPGTKVQTTVGANFRNPYVENYTLGVQQQLGRVAVMELRYVGNHAVAQFQSINANPLVGALPLFPVAAGYQTLAQAFPNLYPASSYCTTPGAVGFGHPDCNRTFVQSRNNTAFSKYNALQSQVRFADYKGLSGSIAYTFSRAIDNASEIFSTGGGGNTVAFAQSPTDIDQGERGVSATSYPNVVAVGLVYKLPFYKEQRGIVGRILGGFSLNNIYSHNSGQPYTPYQGTSLSLSRAALAAIPIPNRGQALYSFGDYNFTAGVIGFADTERPILSNPQAPAGSVAINGGPGVGYINVANGAPVNPNQVKWLLNNQYEAINRGTPYPGVGRNTLRGQAVDELDTSIFKTIVLTERVRMELRLNVYNLPNHLYLGTPDAAIADANPANHGDTFGNQYATFENYLANRGTLVSSPFGNGTRNIQVGGKIIF